MSDMLIGLSFDYLLGLAVWLFALACGLVALLVLRRRSHARPKRLLCLNVGLSLWLFLALLTTVEGYFAFIYDQSDAFNATNVSKHWFDRHVQPEQKPLRFHSGGGTLYRDDREFPMKLAPGQRHICFVGDSFTFGHGVNRVADRFSNRVRADLDEAHPGKFVVSNLADAGKELHWIEELLSKIIQDRLPVDIVVYAICLNDIETFDRSYADFYHELNERAPKSPFILNTYFPNLLYYRLQQVTSARIGGYYEHLAEWYAGHAWELMRRELDKTRQLCVDNGIDLRIVVFPFLHNLGPEYPFAAAHLKIAEFCQETGVRMLDLRSVLEPHVADGLMVNRFDPHPNERAHALAAQAIERDLLSDLFQP